MMMVGAWMATLLWLYVLCGFVSGCEFSKQAPVPERIALDCGGPLDRNSHALAYTSTRASTRSALAGTVYATHAWAPRGRALQYVFPVHGGVYSVRLQFAETWEPNAAPGRRLITVLINGRIVKRRLDIYAAGGGLYQPYDLDVLDLHVPCTSGGTPEGRKPNARIIVRIVPIVQNAFISGVIITRTGQQENHDAAKKLDLETKRDSRIVAESSGAGNEALIETENGDSPSFSTSPSAERSSSPPTSSPQLTFSSASIAPSASSPSNTIWTESPTPSALGFVTSKSSASLLESSAESLAASSSGLSQNTMRNVGKKKKKKDEKYIDLNVTFTRVKADYPMHIFEAQGTAIRNGSEVILFVTGGFYGFPDITNHSYGRKFGSDYSKWIRLADIPAPAVTHMAQWSNGGIFCGAGGFIGRDPGRSGRHVWCYNIGNNSWWRLPDLPAARAGGGLILVQSQGRRKLLYAGGVDRERETHSASDHTDYGTTWELDFERPLQSWHDTGQIMPDARNHMAAVESCGRYFFVGGQHKMNEQTGNRPTVSEWIPNKGIWSKTPPHPMPHGLGHVSASVLAYRCGVLVVGGIENGRILSNKVLWWHPTSNRWNVVGFYPHRAATPVCGIHQNILMCATAGEKWSMQNSVFIATLPTLS